MSNININGRTYVGNSISIKNNKVIIDDIEVESSSKVININVEGSIEKIDVTTCDKITVSGDVGIIKTVSGDVKVEGTVWDVSTTSGNVTCGGNIGGDVKTTSGDIKSKKAKLKDIKKKDFMNGFMDDFMDTFIYE